MAIWTAIPDDFGTGGSGINPTGSSPTLKDLLQEVQDNVDLNTDITANTTAIASVQTQVGTGNCEEISTSGALSIVKRTSRLTVSGTKAYTLADATVAGKRKTIFCVTAGSTPHGVVTPAHASGFTTLDFTTTNGMVELEWDGSVPGWKIVTIVGTVTVA